MVSTSQLKVHEAKYSLFPSVSTLILTVVVGLILTSSATFATDDTSVIDKINIAVPIACTISGTGMNTHNASINNGQYNSAIGETELKALCNDNEGFAIYAIGYTDDVYGKTVLANHEHGSAYDIQTGTATTGNQSNWAMKIAKISDSNDISNNPFTIAESFLSFHDVPDSYTKIAYKNAMTDMDELNGGVKLSTTYQAYVSPTQIAGTYTGQVKYTLFHPNFDSGTSFGINYYASTDDAVINMPEQQYGVSSNGTAIISSTKPIREGYGFFGWCTVETSDDICSGDIYRANSSYTLAGSTDNEISLYAIWGTYGELDTGVAVCNKLKTMANNTAMDCSGTANDEKIKSIQMATTLKSGFVPSSDNTISTSTSTYPIYAWYDNTNDAGIIYIYTAADRVRMNSNSTSLFDSMFNLSDISGVANWDASYVSGANYLFFSDSSLSDISALADWDASSLVNMRASFYASGITSASALANWDTSKVEAMLWLFSHSTALTDISGLANWDTSKVDTMSNMFSATGITNVNALANWDTGNVTKMHWMFSDNNSLNDISGLANWDTSNVINAEGMFSYTGITNLSALANWDTGNVVYMNAMFKDNSALTDASALANWNTSSVEYMDYMFAWDKALKTVDVSNWDTSNVTTMKSMFSVGDSYAGNGQLSEIIGFGDLDVSNVTDMTTMFYGAGQMTHYDIANWNVGKVESFNHMFCDNFKLESLDLSRWNVSSAKTIHNMFDDDSSLITVGDVSHWNTASLIDISGWLNGATSFVGNNGTLDLSGWNTSNVKAAGEMFRATKPQTIDLSGWDFGSVINGSWSGAGDGIYYEYGNQLAANQGFSRMFQDIPTLTTVYVSQSGLNSFNTAVGSGAKTTNMWTGSGASSFTVK